MVFSVFACNPGGSALVFVLAVARKDFELEFQHYPLESSWGGLMWDFKYLKSTCTY